MFINLALTFYLQADLFFPKKQTKTAVLEQTEQIKHTVSIQISITCWKISVDAT